jgi:Lsr2
MEKVEIRLEDDLTGGPADETVEFGVDGRGYELDLNAQHAADLRHRLAPFMERARLVPQRRFKATARTAASRERSRQMRAWAEQQGLTVSAHGRLPASVIQEYDRAQSAEPTAGPRGRQAPAKRQPAARRASSTASRGVRKPSRRGTQRTGN